MKVIYQEHINRASVKKNRLFLFVFGDNDQRKGLGGLAKEVRGEPNSFGITVKKEPKRDITSYYNDDEYEDNIKKIGADISQLSKKMDNYNAVVFPKAGIGRGLALMHLKAPKTYKFLYESLLSIGIDNERGINKEVSIH